MAWFELIGGLCLILGLATALCGVLFAIEMLVAILVVRLPGAAGAGSIWTPSPPSGSRCFSHSLRRPWP